MASNVPPHISLERDAPHGAALQHRHWRNRANLASGLRRFEAFLAGSGFDRAPWLVVGLMAGISAWFVLPVPAAWLGLIGGSLAVAAAAQIGARGGASLPYLRQAVTVMLTMVATGCALVWAKSALIGTPPIARPSVGLIEARVLARQDNPAE